MLLISNPEQGKPDLLPSSPLKSSQITYGFFKKEKWGVTSLFPQNENFKWVLGNTSD